MNPMLWRYLFALLLVVTPAFADDGTWIQNNAGDASGDWGVGTNWADTTIANGAGFTADFSTLDISATSTVSLDQARVIGNLVFGDTATSTSQPVGWVISNGGTATNTLMLAGSLANPNPTITVNALGGTGSSGDSPFGTATISATIEGTEGFIKDGTGTVSSSILVLTAANTNLSGPIGVNLGALRIKNASALGSGVVTVASGARLQLSASINVANTVNINGSTALYSHQGSNTLSGIVNLQSNSQINLNNNNGNATMTLSGTLNLNGFTLTAQTINVAPAITISGVINGDGMITKVSDGELRITGDNTTTYSGTTRLQRGHLGIGNDGALGAGTLNLQIDNDASAVIKSSNATARTVANPMTFTGGKSNSVAIFGLTSGGTGNLTFTGDMVLSTPSSGNFRTFDVRVLTTFDGDISGDPGITKLSSATLVMNGSNTYKGNTTVNAGTLELGQTGTLTFYIGGSGVNNQLLGTGTATLDGSFAFDLTNAGQTFGDTWTIVDEASLGETYGGTFGVTDFDDIGSDLWRKTLGNGTYYQFSEASGSLTFVPEPSSLGLLAIGAFGLLRRRRRD